MPNIKSAKKRVITSKANAVRNTAGKSALRTEVKKVKEAIAAGSETVEETFKNTTSSIDKAVKKNILHKNNAARKKSRLAKAIKKAVKK